MLLYMLRASRSLLRQVFLGGPGGHGGTACVCVSVCFGAFCRSWPVLAFLGRFWSLLVALGAHLGRPWGVLGSLLAALGVLLGVLGLLLAALGALLAALGAILAALGDPWPRHGRFWKPLAPLSGRLVDSQKASVFSYGAFCKRQ